MALAAKLELRQSQALVMTPQLQQAIRLLQLSNMELNSFVETELERNPLLERDDDEPSPGEPRERSAEADERDGGQSAQDGEPAEAWSELSKPASDPASVLDTDYENVFPDTAAAELSSGSFSSSRLSGNGAQDEDTNFEAFIASELSLKDHLSQQLPIAIADPIERLIGGYLIDMVDEAGYLSADLAALADKLGAPLALMEKVLKVLQTFEPSGVFARNLAECLAIQLREQNRYDPQIAALLGNLELLGARNFPALKRIVGCDAEDLAEMISDIKRLNPKPGLKFGSVQMQPVVPDVLVRGTPTGGWRIELNSETLPRVLVNRNYYALVAKTSRSEKDKGYLTDCLQTANWLVKSLDQRARTILRVAEEIIRQQDGFFAHGIQHLRPLNLRTVADAIKMHESTVSRVTSNKYMATPRGIFELKYFFTSSIAASDSGEAHSSESVRFRIKQLIDAESAEDVLSDDALVDRLKSDGIDIARRTVAKYREAMRIPSSVQRRREKRVLQPVADDL